MVLTMWIVNLEPQRFSCACFRSACASAAAPGVPSREFFPVDSARGQPLLSVRGTGLRIFQGTMDSLILVRSLANKPRFFLHQRQLPNGKASKSITIRRSCLLLGILVLV
ncbi:hypothetical protein VTK26DRAFT_3852 [Humicola hyalothermophila]